MSGVLLRGGEVLEPETGRRERADVLLCDGLVAAVGAGVGAQDGGRVVDVSGKLVTPGLIDLHAHGFWGITYDGLRVDAVAGRSGVTTWVDAGSSGAQTFPGFKKYVIEASRTRIVPLLNVCATGIIYRVVEEFIDLRHADVGFAIETILEHRDLIAGVKVRLGRSTVGDNDDSPLWLAREVADQTELPLVVHVADPPPTVPRILAALRAGDVVTHCFRANSWGGGTVLLNGKIRPEIRDARERGVLFDVGHGAGGFSFDVARAALDQGFPPDTISSDLHQAAIQGAARDLPNVLSKFLALGMPPAEVLRRATVEPAKTLRRTDGLGTLRVGAPADVAVFELEEGEYEFADVRGVRLRGSQRLTNVLTFCRGEEMARDGDPGLMPLFTRARR
ncbi:MAG TPA: amidohydrolase/deacetylase family metallohydrolase [Chloroflexota bacterium]|nr:amidohydrolase/deacetylase family metallohydrolase [Chloroflexota bacterium]